MKRKPGDFTNYTNADQGFTCNTCGGDIKAAPVRHSVHFREFSGPVGGGEVRTTMEPYCPTCEEKPSPHGAPIRE